MVKHVGISKETNIEIRHVTKEYILPLDLIVDTIDFLFNV
jgi:hypothetical protein